MRPMKDSGYEWLGDIPSNWEIKKIASLYKLRNEKVSDKDFPALSVSMKGIVPQLETAAKTNDGDNRKLVCKGDFAINSRSDRRGSCGISDYDGSVSLINTVLQPRKNMHPKFYDWFFHSTRFADEFYRWGHGIVDDLWTTGWQDMKKISILYPPLDEQKKIADFLDEKCAEIDGLITDLNEEISTLEEYKRSTITEAVCKGLDPNAEMKDSGIEWIGKIPTNFTMIKTKYLCNVRNGLTYSPTDVCGDNEGVLVLRSSNIKDGKLAFDDNVFVNCEIKSELKVKKGDILICSRNGSRNLIGKNAIIEEDLNASFGAFMMIARGIDNPKYMYYILNSNVFSYYLGTFLTATINQLTGFNFSNMIIPYCYDREIQEEIVEFLNEKCKSIDAVISEKQEQISTLEQYKKSIIYEYTTGKKEVV